MRYDAIVLGLGGMGSAALYHLARRGRSVLGLEQFGVAHDRGSSHGETRIIRKAYFEHPDYVPLLHRAYEEWASLEREAGVSLFTRCGLLLAGRAAGVVIPGVRRSASEHRLPIEELSPAEAARRFPGVRLNDGFEVLYEAEAGFLWVEQCVRTYVERAVAHGAVVRTGVSVTDWSADAGGEWVRVRAGRDVYEARALVIAAGAWSGSIVRELGLPLTVRRKVQLWFPAEGGSHGLDAGFPAFCFDTAEGFFYGFPAMRAPGGRGSHDSAGDAVSADGMCMKIAEHTGDERVADPAELDRALHARDVERVAAFVRRHLPGVAAAPLRHSVCMYTMTPDEHFILDLHPRHANVALAAGFSGHGFKFASIAGSILADLAETGATGEPIGFLSVGRFIS